MVPGSIRIDLPSGEDLYVIHIDGSGVRVEGASVPPGQPPKPDDDPLDRIVDVIYEWLKESGLLKELKKRLIRKALAELGL
jgi:hypothetical protein